MNLGLRSLGVMFLMAALALPGGLCANKAWAENGGGGVMAASLPADHGEAEQNYAGLTELVSMVCEEAVSRFQGFYEARPVYVQPFVAVKQYPRRNISLLGITLADQMTAMINIHGLAAQPPLEYDESAQWMQGVLQEIDGYLRLHISGMNALGERRSYVVHIEMSEPIYRALHTYVHS